MMVVCLWATVTSRGSLSQRGGTEVRQCQERHYCLNTSQHVTSDYELGSQVSSGCSIGSKTGVAATVLCSQAEEEDVAGEDIILDLEKKT